VILALPLLGAFVNGVFGKRLGREAVTLMALGAVGAAFVASVVAFFMVSSAQDGETLVRFRWLAWEWFSLSTSDFSQTRLDVAFSLDALSSVMILVITGIGFLIHLYSSKYMEEDPGYYRFFTYLNLFIFSMLVLVLGDSLPILFVGWEGVGLCSYLLIGFWFTKNENASAGKKAFITNRIGDFGLLVAMGLLLYFVGALDWAGIEAGKQQLLAPVKLWPIGNEVPIAALLPQETAAWVNEPRYVSGATLVCLFLFLGCAGKSAQLPLYVWLPDAMAGPTPVSALIHAATMVTAGVYLVCRMAGVFVLSPAAMFTVAFVGGLTALFAATIALVQNDIKKVLAYSTVSQLGYMFLGVGVGAFVAGFFHVLTHAFFKACLFLGAGSVIHAMHARIHDTDQSQDMRYMGGLRKFMPVTFATFAAAWAAIVGFPLTSGFFSKDEILLKANTSFVKGGEVLAAGGARIETFEWPSWGPWVLWGMGATAAILTAFYMTRLFFGTFFGDFRGWTIVPGYQAAGHGHDAHDAHGHDAHAAHDDHAGHDEHHAHETPGPDMQGPEPHESPWQMTLPLVILGALSVVAGFLSAHLFHVHPIDDFLAPVFQTATGRVEVIEGHEARTYPLIAFAVLAFASGVGVAYWIYLQAKGEPARQIAESFPRLHHLLLDKWRVDELYEETILGAIDTLADMCVWFDKWIVDGILARLSTALVALAGTVLRQFQTGRLQSYAAAMVVGVAAVGWFVLTPRAAARSVEDHAAGNYQVVATPGFGYSYRWDSDGDDTWDTEEYGDQRALNFSLGVEESRTVRLEVKNALGQTAEREFSFVRPRPDKSGAMPASTRIDVTQGADGRAHRVAPPHQAPGRGGPEQGGPELPPGHPQVSPEQMEKLKRALEGAGMKQ
jgi:NADH-quinone oxidoreductase subunit L